MIVRAVLTDPSLLDRFDYFNDAKDTIVWLSSSAHPDAPERLQQLRDRAAVYWRDFAKRKLGRG